MLISCTSCNSKYLVNSADLKPDGRTVQCANCGNQWYQDHILVANNLPEIEVPVSVTSTNTQKSKKESKTPTPNLPSTYVKEEKVSIVNSFLVVFFVVLLIGSFWIIPSLDINSLVLIKFYLGEFIFNLKLIFDDIAKLIHHIIN